MKAAAIPNDWKKCIICQEKKFPPKKFPLAKGTEKGIERILHCAKIRVEIKYEDNCSRILESLDSKEDDQAVLWHRYCYSSFTNEGHITRLCKKHGVSEDSNGEGASAKRPRRSSLGKMDWEKCMFCQSDMPAKVTLNQVQTFETSEKIISKSKCDSELSRRLAGVSDLIAAEGRYHLKCYMRFQRKAEKVSQSDETDQDPTTKCFDEIMALLKEQLSQGHIFSLKAVWTCYSRKLEHKYHVRPGVYRSNRFKEKVKAYLGKDAVFVPPLNPSEPHLLVSADLSEQALRSLLKEPANISEELSEDGWIDDLDNDDTEDVDLDAELLTWLYRVAVKVHHDIKSAPSHDCIGKISQTSAEEIVPESLYLLISLLCCGYEDEKAPNEIKGRILSICQDILFLSSRGHKLTPKHIGLGLTVHQATRSKQLIQLLFSAGHSVSYDTVLRMDNSIANNVLERFKENGNVFLPRSFIASTEEPANYIRYAIDNIDINEETLSGMGTFHATQIAAFRRKDENEPEMDIEIPLKSERQLDLQVPSELHELEELSLDNRKPEPNLAKPVVLEWYSPDANLIDQCYKKDLAWILGRLHAQQPDLQTIPGWTGFNQLLATEEPQVTFVGPLPIVNAPAHEFETLWTVIRRCKAMSKQLSSTAYTIITMDEGLYNKAKMLQWSKSQVLPDVIIMLGGFHTQMTFSKVIGKYLESSGMSEMWAESEVFGETTATNILKGKLWNRVIRAHKLSYEALWRILWPMLTKWAKEKGDDRYDNLENISERFAAQFTSKGDSCDPDVYSSLIDQAGPTVRIIREFDEEHKADSTFRYWRQYMRMVTILLRFTRAIREGNWELYLSSFSEMLPWFAVFDHTNYTRWGVIFLAEMKMLPQIAPEIYQAFERGEFVTKETENLFNQISDDQALEHVNRSGKVAGGLVGITRTDAARDRWCLTYNERAKLSEDTKEMLGVSEKEAHGSKDLGRSRMQRDAEDVLKLETQFRKYQVFRSTPDLVVVTTGDVASDAIKTSLLGAEEDGKDIVKDFVESRLIRKDVKFHDTLKQRKLMSFESLYSVNVSVDKSKKVIIKADKDLLRRVIVALESGRDVDVDKLLQNELSVVPKSLATVNGCLREAAKSDLGTILQANVSQSQQPISKSETCTIIDGMAAVQLLSNSTGAKTFGEWSDRFLGYVTSHFSGTCSRVDVVFDRYIENSIKEGTRDKRKDGKQKGILKKIERRDQKIGNWERFILLEDNKAGLADFLSREISQNYTAPRGKELVLSGGFSEAKKVWSSKLRIEQFDALSSDHEEADTRILLHARDATRKGFKQVNVLCRDTDVLVLLLFHRQQLCDEVWMFAGTSKRKRYIPVHQIPLSEEKQKSLLAFHALTGCDTTSQFYGIVKATAWKVFQDVPQLLEDLGEESPISSRVFADAEAFVSKLYNTNTQEVEINKERAAAFRRSRKDIDALPPTQDALRLHISRAHYQTMIWKRALQPCPSLPRPEDSGWRYNEGVLRPQLMTQEVVSEACLQLAFCGCSREDSCCINRRCKCVRLSLICSKACKCSDRCRNTGDTSADEDEA